MCCGGWPPPACCPSSLYPFSGPRLILGPDLVLYTRTNQSTNGRLESTTVKRAPVNIVSHKARRIFPILPTSPRDRSTRAHHRASSENKMTQLSNTLRQRAGHKDRSPGSLPQDEEFHSLLLAGPATCKERARRVVDSDLSGVGGVLEGSDRNRSEPYPSRIFSGSLRNASDTDPCKPVKASQSLAASAAFNLASLSTTWKLGQLFSDGSMCEPRFPRGVAGRDNPPRLVGHDVDRFSLPGRLEPPAR